MPAPKDPIKYQEWKKKISNKGKHWKLSEETKKKISEMWKGKPKPWLKGRKITWADKISKAHKGKKLSEKTKKKISEALKGDKNPAKRPEVRKKLSETKKGDKNPSKRLEVRKKISEIQKGQHRSLKTEFKKGEQHPNWKGGKSFEPYPLCWTKELRQAIRQRDNFTCQLCGKYPAFHIHHIDYNKENCEPENLITLCHNCHSKTNHNREYWKGLLQNLMKNKKVWQ
jgi:5-methylcytosine-specific restriction endonuclease McrA